MAGSVVNVRWSNEFMSKLDEIKRELAGKLTEALERAEAAEAELARLKSLLIAWNLEPDGTYNQPAYWALNSEASKLAWEAYQLALKGGEG